MFCRKLTTLVDRFDIITNDAPTMLKWEPKTVPETKKGQLRSTFLSNYSWLSVSMLIRCVSVHQ